VCGDQDSPLFDEVFERWLNEGRASELINWAFRCWGHLGEDLAQEACQNFLKKYRGKPSTFCDVGRLSSALKVATLNLLRDFLRAKRSRLRHYPDYLMPACEEDPGSSEQDLQEVFEILAECMERLQVAPVDILTCLVGCNPRPPIQDLVEKAAAHVVPAISPVQFWGWTRIDDVAGALGIPAGTLRSRKHRQVIPQLQQELERLGVRFEWWDFS
jgi:hypothetical protein